MTGTQSLSPRQLSAIEQYRFDIDAGCDIDRFVTLTDGTELVVGSVVIVNIHQMDGTDAKRVDYHLAYGGTESIIVNRDGSLIVSKQFVDDAGNLYRSGPQPRVFAEDDLVSFEGEHTMHDRFNRIGIAWDGGRQEHGGPVVESPFPFTYRLAHVIDNHGGSAEDARQARANTIRADEVIGFVGLDGWYRVHARPHNGGIKFIPVKEMGVA